LESLLTYLFVILAHIITQAYRCIGSCLAAEFTQ